jgi:hypothetical protein
MSIYKNIHTAKIFTRIDIYVNGPNKRARGKGGKVKPHGSV